MATQKISSAMRLRWAIGTVPLEPLRRDPIAFFPGARGGCAQRSGERCRSNLNPSTRRLPLPPARAHPSRGQRLDLPSPGGPTPPDAESRVPSSAGAPCARSHAPSLPRRHELRRPPAQRRATRRPTDGQERPSAASTQSCRSATDAPSAQSDLTFHTHEYRQKPRRPGFGAAHVVSRLAEPRDSGRMRDSARREGDAASRRLRAGDRRQAHRRRRGAGREQAPTRSPSGSRSSCSFRGIRRTAST